VTGLLIRGAELDREIIDVLVESDRVRRIGRDLETPPGFPVYDAAGGALLPGLVDHHVHVMAAAAAARSVDVSGPDWATALVAAEGTGWCRAVGASRELNRDDLDVLGLARPLRVQHRSGALWTLNQAAIDAIDELASVRGGATPLSETERRTGQLWRADDRLRAMLPAEGPPDLAGLGRRLAARGVTTVVDATPTMTEEALALLTAALPQRVVALGRACGQQPRKLVVADHALPSLEALAGRIRDVHEAGRGVAVHCVTREALVLTLVALREAGPSDGDRIEHAAVCDDELARQIAALGAVVVTQPSLVRLRGAEYLAETAAVDRPWLWRHAGLLAAGVPVALSSDAPHGDPDPWRTIAAAADRRTADGTVLGADERVSPLVALAAMLTSPLDPGGPPTRVRVGAEADLCVLDRPLEQALARPDEVGVGLTVVGDSVVHENPAAHVTAG